MKTKLQIQRFFTVILCLLLSAAICNAQDKLAKKTVDDFLNVWLIKKDLKLVQKYFAKNLFTNKYLFKEDCRSSDDIQRKSKKIRQETIRFFRVISQNTETSSLKGILISDNSIRDFSDVELLSDTQRDKFILTKEDRKAITGDIEQSNYLKSKFPSEKYLILRLKTKTKYDGEEGSIPLGILWTRQNSHWKIVYFGIECQ